MDSLNKKRDKLAQKDVLHLPYYDRVSRIGYFKAGFDAAVTACHVEHMN